MTSFQRLMYLDSLRAIAIVGVIAAHTAQAVGDIQRFGGGDIDGWLLSFFNQGGYGVQVFFFLSGYLLAMLYGFGHVDLRQDKSTKSFWVKRIFRIFPLWALFFLMTVARPSLFPASPGAWVNSPGLVAPDETLNSLVLFALTLTFLMWLVPVAWGGFIPGGWSIQAEMLHYGFFALVRKWRVEAILGLWLALAIPTIFIDKLLSRVDLDLGVLEGWRSQNMPSTLIFFLAGCVFFMLKDHSRREQLSGSARVLTVLATLVVLLLPLNNVKSGQFFAAVGFVAFAVVLAYFLARWESLHGLLSRVAKYSYFSYFFHFFLLDILETLYNENVGRQVPFGQIGVGLAVVGAVLLVTFICTVVGSVSWKIFEKPAISMGERLARRS